MTTVACPVPESATFFAEEGSVIERVAKFTKLERA